MLDGLRQTGATTLTLFIRFRNEALSFWSGDSRSTQEPQSAQGKARLARLG